MHERFAVYRTSQSIPRIGAQPGDLLVVDPSDQEAPVQVVRQIRDRAVAAGVLRDERDHLHLIHTSGPLDLSRLIMEVANDVTAQ